jgi:tetratricopeptide (TPR) repeat protein
MKTPAYKSLTFNNYWLNIAEIIAVTSSIGGTIASILLQKYLYVSLPLSASVALSLFNRQRMANSVALKAIQIEHLETQNKQSDQLLVELSQQLEQQNELIFSQFSTEMQTIRHQLLEVGNLNKNLDNSFDNLNKQQDEISKLIKELRIEETQDKTIISVSDPADFCFNLALANQEGGNLDRAIENYTKAIEKNSSFTQAYHNLGLLYLEMEDNRKAIDNLRKASQLYFEQNDLEKYQETKNLSLELYNKEKESDANIQQDKVQIAACDLFN